MKARLILNESNEKLLLCADGSILAPDNENLLFIFSDFRGISTVSGSDGNWSSYCKDMAMYPGETLAYVSDDLSLVITEPSFLRALVSPDFDTETYIGLVEYAKKVNRSEQIIKVLCREGRIAGAKKISGRWMIPENAPYPVAPSRRHDKP